MRWKTVRTYGKILATPLAPTFICSFYTFLCKLNTFSFSKVNNKESKDKRHFICSPEVNALLSGHKVSEPWIWFNHPPISRNISLWATGSCWSLHQRTLRILRWATRSGLCAHRRLHRWRLGTRWYHMGGRNMRYVVISCRRASKYLGSRFWDRQKMSCFYSTGFLQLPQSTTVAAEWVA